MELNEFVGHFKEQYIDSTDIELKPDTDFRSIESYDSLTGMALLVVIKEHFNIDIANEQWKELRTVGDVYDYIKNKT